MVPRVLFCAFACVIAVTAQVTTAEIRIDGARARTPQLLSFDGPGASQTYASGINNNGTITGFLGDATGAEHGYLRYLGGDFVTFDAPGSNDITPDSINSNGAVAGSYGDTRTDGFLRNADGTFTTFTVPGMFPSSSGNPIVINDSGIIAGPYFDATEHGFVRLPSGSVSTIDFPGSADTAATGINADGVITGIYLDATFTPHGFVRENFGEWVSFDVPGNNFGFFNPTLSINNVGEVVGSYYSGTTHGFLWHAGSTLQTFDVAGAVATLPAGINSSGAVAGSYQDSSFTYHGFVRSPSGAVYTFSAPNAANGTYAVGINDSGVVAGYYIDSTYTSHGFVLIM